ncbi:MAG: hypothetical protein ACM3O3_03015 [Syntrophothermus sp.]
MKNHIIKNSNMEVGVTEECGFLHPIKFIFRDKVIEPMHIAPWINEELDSSIDPMLKNLRGDFFCAPFSTSDILEDEKRGHGSSANDKWDLIGTNNNSMKFKLAKTISEAELIKEVNIHEEENVVYQKHTFIGGKGKIPIGHHAMLKIQSRGYLSFSEFKFGGTPPTPIEPDEKLGQSILKYPQEFTDLKKLKMNDNSIIDASVYPFSKGHEDLLMVVSKDNLPFGWSALSCPNEGWLWFSIKNINILPSTVIWMSNGGRYYPPFSSRHNNVIGIEEVNSYYHLGHKASIEENDLSKKSFSTYINLRADLANEIPYLFGLVEITPNFGRIKEINEIKNGIEIIDDNGNKIFAKVNLNFIKDIK